MVPLSLKPKIIEEKDNKAIFEIEALYPGYGVTIGNTLRRVLLSSLDGAAITQVKIKGVQHEFSTISGVLEDVISIILNLKKLRFKLFSDESQKATLKVNGEKKVKASDFKLPSQVEILNKNAGVATLTSKSAELEMEIQIEKGLGYVPVEKRKKEKIEMGYIAIDAIFTPVKRVSFRVENMRVGERTDFDRLFLEIETDGTITPEESFLKTSGILADQFSLFKETFNKIEKLVVSKKSKKEKSKKDDSGKIKLEDLKLSGKTQNILIKNNIKTVSGILRKNEKNLLELKGMGKEGIKEIKKALKKINLELKK